MKDRLNELIKEMMYVQGRWNGDEGGYAEEQASIATDIIEKSKELIDLINEFNGTN
jgi:hypothetical protein